MWNRKNMGVVRPVLKQLVVAVSFTFIYLDAYCTGRVCGREEGGSAAMLFSHSIKRATCGTSILPLSLRLRGGKPAGLREDSVAHDVEKATALLEKARAGYAAAGVRPPEKIEKMDKLNKLLTEHKEALIKGDRHAINALKKTMGTMGQDDYAEDDDGASVIDSDEDREDWEDGVDKLKVEGDAILKEMRTGVKRGPDYNHWDEIPALRKAELMINEDTHHPLWTAVRDGNADRLRYLLKANKMYDVNHRFPALWNSSLLHVAAECNDVEVATILVNSGAHIEGRNAYHQAPLHLATYWGNTGVVSRLVDMGAFVEARSSDDSTPLHIAAFYGQLHTAEALVSLGASLTSVNQHNQNALQLAEMGKWVEIAAWLRKLMHVAPLQEGQELKHVQDYEALKEQAIERLASDMEKKLQSANNGPLSHGAEGPLPSVDVREAIRAAVDKQAHVEATLALQEKIRHGGVFPQGGLGGQTAALAAAAAAAATVTAAHRPN